MYLLFYVAFCIYFAYFLRSKVAAAMLLVSLISWAAIRLSPEINADFNLKALLLLVSYGFEFVILGYFLPKRVMEITKPDIKKSLIIASFLLILFSLVVLYTSLYIPYLQTYVMSSDTVNVNQVLSEVNFNYRLGIFSGYLCFFTYIYLWFGISKLMFTKR